jgi:hypothetical protein
VPARIERLAERQCREPGSRDFIEAKLKQVLGEEVGRHGDHDRPFTALPYIRADLRDADLRP